MGKRKTENRFSEEVIRRKRAFPIKNTVWLIVLALLQLALIYIIVFVSPQPKDIIKEYNITVEPLSDGKLEAEYAFVWNAVSKYEELTWVDIGMPNNDYTVDDKSVSDNVSSFTKISDNGYTALRLYFNKPYIGGETFEFSYKVIQGKIISESNLGYYYELVPGWFNSIPVEKYCFRWKYSEDCISADDAVLIDGYLTWQGSLGCGEYERMFVQYNDKAFSESEPTDIYWSLDNIEAYNQLEEDRIGRNTFLIVLIVLLVFAEIYIVDSYVSYHKGRGFLSGHGHHVHLYGRSNPLYYNAHRFHHHSSGSFRGGGTGCACACACACAGGGRAGCSQKDTVSFFTDKERKNK